MPCSTGWPRPALALPTRGWRSPARCWTRPASWPPAPTWWRRSDSPSGCWTCWPSAARYRQRGCERGGASIHRVRPYGRRGSVTELQQHAPVDQAVAARAFWLREPGAGEIRNLRLTEPGADEVLVRALRSGVSRGTETLVFR